MDSSAYLARQGWRGNGHSLHPTGRGLKKPLLIARKNNVLGVGKKKNDVDADQWWNHAFDEGLKSLTIGSGNPASERKSGPTILKPLVDPVPATRWNGLYNSFIQGETLGGTMYQAKVAVVSTSRANIDTKDSPITKPGPRAKRKKKNNTGAQSGLSSNAEVCFVPSGENQPISPDPQRSPKRPSRSSSCPYESRSYNRQACGNPHRSLNKINPERRDGAWAEDSKPELIRKKHRKRKADDGIAGKMHSVTENHRKKKAKRKS